MTGNDLRDLRNAFGVFMTGVTVVTTKQADGIPRGFTANSFCSVSLDPPLLSVCVSKFADSLDTFNAAGGFAVNILSEHQTEISSLFASKRQDKFDQADWRNGPQGHPILDQVSAWFDCQVEQRIDAGDHMMLIGRVQAYGHNEQSGLGYVRGGYTTLGMEQAAMTAAGKSNGLIVGAVVEARGKLLLTRNHESGRLQPLATGLAGDRGSILKLNQLLDSREIGAAITSLYAVFENLQSDQQFVYYRATANQEDKVDEFYKPDEVPWEQLENTAIVSMLKRYIAESRVQRYGVYFGNESTGTVQLNT